MKHIFFRELISLLKDNRFIIFLVIMFILSAVNGRVSSYNFQSLQESNQVLRENYERQIEQRSKRSLQGVAMMEHLALEEVSPSLFLAGDQHSVYPNHKYVQIPTIYFGNLNSYYPKRSVDFNVFSLPFLRYDMLFLVEVILSFMIIILAYNSVSKEREDRTMALLLSNSISRTTIILGKIAAYTLVSFIALLLSLITQLLTIYLIGYIPVDASIYANLALFAGISVLYILLWVVITVCVSCASRKSNVSLTYLLIIWLAFVFIIPSSGKMLIERIGEKLPTSEMVNADYDRIRDDMWNEVAQNNGGWRGGNLRANEADNHAAERAFAPVYLKYLDIMEELQYSLASREIAQLKQLYNYSSLSPCFLFRRIAEGISNNQPEVLLNSSRTYRLELMNTFEKLDLEDPESFHLMYLPNYMSQKPVDREDIPVFSIAGFSYGNESERNIEVLITILLCEILLLFTVCQVTFNRADIR